MAPTTATIGAAAPDLDLEVCEAEGSTSTSSLLALRPAGKVLVVDFFAPWCKTCPAKAKELDALAKGAYSDSCVFVLVCVDGGADAARDFAAAHNIEKCIIAAAEDEDAPSDVFLVKGLPHCAVIDSNGVLFRNYDVSLPADLDACLNTTSNNASGYPATATADVVATGAPVSSISGVHWVGEI